MITAIIQARISSTRLPGKIMLSLAGKSLLEHIIERIRFSKSISDIVIATTTSRADDIIANWAYNNSVKCFRGSETDVLNRYYESAKHFGARHIARITSDDPFKDPAIIDAVAELYFNERLDFAYNNNPPTFAEGLDTEIFSFEALGRAETEAHDPFEREHVTQHFYRNPRKFRQDNLKSAVDYSHLRWTVDTPDDLKMAEAVYKELYKPGQVFHAQEILNLLERKPEIALINQGVERSAMYNKQK